MEHWFDELEREIINYLPDEQVHQIRETSWFVAAAHDRQQRKSGEPYVMHPLAVATILAKMRMEARIIIAALLHDVIEDTGVSKSTLSVVFSPGIAELVEGVSKDKRKLKNPAETQARNLYKLFLAMSQDVSVFLIKGADRIHNMRTLGALSPEKRRRIARDTIEFYVPLAKRFNIKVMQTELEALCFATLLPFRYKTLQAAVQRSEKERKALISKIHESLYHTLVARNVSVLSMRYELPHLYRIYKRMQQHHLSFKQAMDIPSFCIVVENMGTCYDALDGIHALYPPMPDYFHDYIASPKGNGYQALHTTIIGGHLPINVRICTPEMDSFARNGIASYWSTNSMEVAALHATQMHEWLQKLLFDAQQNTSNAFELMQSIKIDLASYLSTTQEELVTIPNVSQCVPKSS